MEREDIINKKFPHSFWGYDVTEVDLFLDEVIRELDRLHNELEMAGFMAEAARQREEKLLERLDASERTEFVQTVAMPYPGGDGDDEEEPEEDYDEDDD